MTNLPESWCVSVQDPQFEEFKPFFKWLTKESWAFLSSHYGFRDKEFYCSSHPSVEVICVNQVKETIEWQEYLHATNHIPEVGKMIESDELKAFNEKIEEEARELYRSMWIMYDEYDDRDPKPIDCFEVAEAAYKRYIERFSKKPIDNTDQK